MDSISTAICTLTQAYSKDEMEGVVAMGVVLVELTEPDTFND